MARKATKPMEEMVTTDTDLGPAPILPKAKREITAESIRDARKATGTQLLDYLIESGTNHEKIAAARQWMIENDDATAEQCFRYLESAEELGDQPIALGTMRKAGKWIWGDAWEPESAVFQAPQEELKRLREQRAADLNEIARKNSEIAGLKSQIGYLESRNKEMGSENDYLKASRTPDGPGHNVLAGANSTAL